MLALNVVPQIQLTGYSEGGFVTMAVAKLVTQRGYLRDFPIKAVSSGAGPYDLEAFATRIVADGFYPVPSNLVFLWLAYNATYGWERPIESVFQPPYSDRIAAGLFDFQTTSSQVFF